jgi:eukaryotic-like serine/threonine-protein kinase
MSVTNTGPVDDDLLGQRVGDSYIIVERLGEGGMGAVYLATSAALAGQQAAVKVLLPELSRKPEVLTRFRAEAYAAGKVNDPNIVRIFDTGELPGGRAYILMEFCGGGSLATLLRQRGPLAFDLVLTILSPIASALATAHKARITHRDLKPENILIDRDGTLMRGKLADFGIAKLHDQVGVMKTGTQKILGSPGYMAPEQCGARGGVDSRADIYAFGSVLYEVVTGQRPYPGNSLYELIQNVATNAPFPPPSSLRRDLPPEWEAVILGCLAHRRDDRIQTVREVIQRLARALPNGEVLMSFFAHRMVDDTRAPTAATLSDGIGPAATLWSESQPTAPRRTARARLAIALGGGLVLGSTATALIMRGGSPAATPSAPPVVAPVATIDAAPPPAIDAPIAIDAAKPDAAIIKDAAVDAARAVAPPDAAPDAPRPPPPPPVDAGAVIPLTPKAPDKPPPDKHTAPAPVGRGTLRIEVDPWADVTIVVGGQKSTYTTPVTIELPAGRHRVLLSKGAQRETVEVTITPHETTRITRTW